MPRVLTACLAVLAAVGLGLLHIVFGTTLAAQRAEQVVLDAAAGIDERVWAWMRPALAGAPAMYIVVTAVVLAAVVLARRAWWDGLAAVVAFVAANATTQFLKAVVFDRAAVGMPWTGPNSMPSGHTTVAAACGAAILLVSAPRWRPVAAAGGAAFTAYVGTGTIVGGWHRPADVVAACLVVAGWFLLAAAFLPRERGWFATSAILGALAVGAGVLSLVGLAQVWDVASPTQSQLSVAFVAACAAVVAGAAGAFALLLAARGRDGFRLPGNLYGQREAAHRFPLSTDGPQALAGGASRGPRADPESSTTPTAGYSSATEEGRR